MPAKVADASVIAAIMFNEDNASIAADLIRDADLHAPRLLPFELASVACKKARLHREFREDTIAALELLASLNITYVDCPPDKVARLALLTGLTVNDAAYLYAALVNRSVLVTFDQRLARAAQSLTRV